MYISILSVLPFLSLLNFAFYFTVQLISILVSLFVYQLLSGHVPQLSPVLQQKSEAMSEDNAESNYSSDNTASKQKNNHSSEKGSDVQVSISSSFCCYAVSFGSICLGSSPLKFANFARDHIFGMLTV